MAYLGAVVFILSLVITGLPAHSAFAAESFHSGSAGKCEECHLSARNDETGDAAAGTGSAARGAVGSRNGKVMLRGSDPSSTCLRCHEAPQGAMQPQGHFVSSSNLGAGLAPTQLTPGGDFGWLRKNFQWQSKDGGNERSAGDRHGHNIVAADYSYAADGTLRTAPGGTFQSANLSCTSCHDPHGRYRRDVNGTISTTGPAVGGSGSYTNSADPDSFSSVSTYRMLAGKGYQQKWSSGAAFIADPPAAVAPVTYNRSEASTDTRVAYGSGMSEWCQNCHSSIHKSDGMRASQHPAGNNARLSADTTNNYNFYVASGNLSGRQDTAYTSMVPFEMGTDDYTVLKQVANSNGSNTAGPDGSANVMCLSCHRAHASGWDSMTRWNTKSTMLVANGRYPGIDNGASVDDAQGRTEAETRKTFYDRPASRYALYQRSLCNKCHAKD